jgi:endonuclease III related protein
VNSTGRADPRRGPHHGLDLVDIYLRLRLAFGHRHWWPGNGPFEITVGAILTQNTAWTNVEKALANLEDAVVRDWQGLFDFGPGKLEGHLRPAGYYNQKADRLRSLARWIVDDHHGSIEGVWDGLPTEVARQSLLARRGIGPETADSILLYAGGHATFVVDAYTRRILQRLGYQGSIEYHDVQRMFLSGLPTDVPLFNDYHAQIVELGKRHCRPGPRCEGCPLGNLCVFGPIKTM